ncbi:DUF2185 domain-containing protein [Mucilaginibacter conchicola]|uniref:DUF2185 domain-containing protein n=2 Tax=Mucilaginibacter conchicola TaxID=2303333 RepID=A0A372P0H9_9SPHI|nr:DUF2185 domain-containing protein [Mucilaginibacter conchicola]
MVSKMITNGGKKPRFMYREKRTRPEDSGWRIFSGAESQQYTDNPDNAGIYNPSTILKIDPSIKDILLKGVGSVYERSGDKGAWVKVTDFKMQDDEMLTHRLTENWNIDINNLFERSVEESGSLMYTTGDKTVRIVIWDDKNRKREELYADHLKNAQNRDQSMSETLEIFDLSDGEAARVGYLIEEGDGDKKYSVIYGFSLTDHQVVQAAFYFDDKNDKDWALKTWKSITPAK